MDLQNHIDLLVLDDGCWMAGGIFEEPYYIIVGLVCGLGLGRGEVYQGNQYCGIHLQGIVQKGAHNFAYHGYAFFW